MQPGDTFAVARHLESMGVQLIRDGFASWIRNDLGFEASDEHVERAMVRVQDMMADGRAVSMQDLAYQIAIEMPARARIDAFGGSAWAME